MTNFEWLQARINYKGNGCLKWPFSRNNSGYGQVPVGRKIRKAHRVMCELAHGDPPSSKHHAAHSCRNRNCINPHHLSWKTPSENQFDRRRDGTTRTNKYGRRGKLTKRDRVAIIALRGKKTQTELAKTFGVHFETISRVQRTLLSSH